MPIASFRAGARSGLVLGAAQLGLADYGIARAAGDTDPSALLAQAEMLGVLMVDAAAAYGACERHIGAYFRSRPGSRLSVTSKLPPDLVIETAASVRDAVAASVERIGRPLAACLIHDSALLPQWDGPLGQGLEQARAEGLTATIGVSVYTPAAFAAALALPVLSHIQAPFNLLDQRLLDSGLLARARAANRTIHLRSIFLQGLLLMRDLPGHMAFAQPVLQRFHDICARFEVSPRSAALAWASARADGCDLVIGCDNAAQLRDNAALLAAPEPDPDLLRALDLLATADERLLNPSLWPYRERP